MKCILLFMTFFAPVMSKKVYTINAEQHDSEYDNNAEYKQSVFLADIYIDGIKYNAAISLTNYMIHAWPNDGPTNIVLDANDEDVYAMNSITFDTQRMQSKNNAHGPIISHNNRSFDTCTDAYHPGFDRQSAKRFRIASPHKIASSSHHPVDHLESRKDSEFHEFNYTLDDLLTNFHASRSLSPTRSLGNGIRGGVFVRNEHDIKTASDKQVFKNHIKRKRSSEPHTKTIKQEDVIIAKRYNKLCLLKDRKRAKIIVGNMAPNMVFCEARRSCTDIQMNTVFKTLNYNAVLGVGFAPSCGNYFVNTLFSSDETDKFVSLNLQRTSLLIEIKDSDSKKNLYDAKAIVFCSGTRRNLHVMIESTSLSPKLMSFVLDLSTPYIWLRSNDFALLLKHFAADLQYKWIKQPILNARKIFQPYPCTQINDKGLPTILLYFEKSKISLEPELYFQRALGADHSLCVLHVGSSYHVKNIQVGHILLKKYRLTMKYFSDAFEGRGKKSMLVHFEEKKDWNTPENINS